MQSLGGSRVEGGIPMVEDRESRVDGRWSMVEGEAGCFGRRACRKAVTKKLKVGSSAPPEKLTADC